MAHVTQHKLSNPQVQQVCHLKPYEGTIVQRGINKMPLTQLEAIAEMFQFQSQAKMIKALGTRLGYQNQSKVTLNDLSADLMAIDSLTQDPMPKPLSNICQDRLSLPCLQSKTCFQEIMKLC